MILIDKEKPFSTIVFNASIDEDIFQLLLKSDSTNQEFQFELDSNLSNSPERYFHYEIPAASYADLPTGYYSYSILTPSGDTFYSGKALVKGLVQNDFIALDTDINDAEYLVYNGE